MDRLAVAAFLVFVFLLYSSAEGSIASPKLQAKIVHGNVQQGAARASTVTVTFQIVRLVTVGEGFAVVGNGTALNDWTVSTSTRMNVTKDDIWTLSTTFTAGDVVYFKLVLIDYNTLEIIEWMPDPNLVLNVPTEYDTAIVMVYWDPSSSSLKQSV